MSEAQSRREFLRRAGRTGLGAAYLALLGCAVSPGQELGGPPASRVATIGYVGASDEVLADDSLHLNPLRQGLRELGWVEGETIRIEVPNAQGDPAAWPDLVAQLVSVPVDVIVTLGGGAPIQAAVAATSAPPIVMVQGPSEALEQGWAASVQRPGGHVTGLIQAPRELFSKRLELLLEVVPLVTRAVYIGGSPGPAEVRHEMARTVGVQVQTFLPRNEAELELTFEAIDRDAAQAVFVEPGTVATTYRSRIIAFAAQRQLLAMYGTRGWAEAGGLMSYGADNAALHRRAAFYVDRILRGANPGDLPIEYPTQYELVINLKTAEALGLTIPDSLLAQATEVIR